MSTPVEFFAEMKTFLAFSDQDIANLSQSELLPYRSLVPVHVKIGLDPMYVEAVMSLIRHDALAVMSREITDLSELVSKYQSLLKVLDIDLMIINYAYAEERLDRLAGFTGMKRTLIENVIRKAKR